MKTIKGPAVFLAQFIDSKPPFNSLEGLCQWAADLGYKGIQIPTWESFLIDLDKAAESQDYCDELKGKIASFGLEITELSTHLQGQLVAVHPAYDLMFDNFAPDAVKNNPKARTEWAIDTVKKAATASRRLGLNAHATFSGSLLWHTMHPWPQRPAGLVEMGVEELIAYCREEMAGFKIPKKVVLGPIDKTSTGKVQKYLLRDRAEEVELVLKK